MHMLKNCYSEIISPENLWRAWVQYRKGKRDSDTLLQFERRLEENLISLHDELLSVSYTHGGYRMFHIHDPKERLISIASVRDHVVHQAVYQILYPFFDTIFLPQSFSSRLGRGTSAALSLFHKYLRKQGENTKKSCVILHGDIQKCFDSIDHNILVHLLSKRVTCEKTLDLLRKIIRSYHSSHQSRGIPLGNVTSQLFINIYLHELDVFAKSTLMIPRYLRYSDDFVALFSTHEEAFAAIQDMKEFLWRELRLLCPDDHIKIKKNSQGIEILGVRFISGYSVIRPSTRRRTLALFDRRVQEYENAQRSLSRMNSSWRSLRGMIVQGNNFSFQQKLHQLIP